MSYAHRKSPSKPPTPVTSQQVTTKLCTVVYSLGFNAARSGCSQTPKWSPYCGAQQCVPWEMRTTITSSWGHLFKDNKPGLSMLSFYGVVPALKATTAANPAPNPHSPIWPPLFVSEFITWEVHWPPTPTDTHPALHLRAPRGWDHHFESWLVSQKCQQLGKHKLWPGNSLGQRKKYTAA